MLESMVSAWSLATLLPRFYTLLASVLGELAVVAFLVSKEVPSFDRPTDVVGAAFNVLKVPAPPILTSVSQWVQERGDLLTSLAAVVAVLATAQSLAYLAGHRYRFDKVRGPATCWLAVAVIAEAQGRAGFIAVPLCVVGLTIPAVATDLIRRGRRGDEFGHFIEDEWRVSATWGMFLFGAVVVLVFAIGTFLHAIGGPIRNVQKASAHPEA